MDKKVITTNNAPEAVGPYSQAIEANGMLFLSGMLPIDPTTGYLVPGGIKEQTAQVFMNIKAVLSAAGTNVNNIVKTTVFLEDMSHFGAMNEVYAAQFSDTFPARSSFAVKTLPKNAMVEIEVIAIK